MSKQITALIPNYNGSHLLEKNIDSVVAALRAGDELLIVDDASTDSSIAFLQNKFHLDNELKGQYIYKKNRIDISILKNKKNLRFAQAVNRGFKEAKYSLVLLLNNDVLPNKNLLTYLLPILENDNVFGIGCLEYESNDMTNASGKNLLWFEKGIFFHAKAKEFSAGETAWISGGSGIFDRKKWIELNGFDTDFYPAYWEDIDISYRARKKGWEVLFEPKAIVHHKHESTNKSAFGIKKIMTMSWRHADLFTRKHATPIQMLLFYLWRPYWWYRRFRVLQQYKNSKYYYL